MCLAEVIVRPLTMRLLDPWPLHRTHRLEHRLLAVTSPQLQHYCNPYLHQGGCRSNRQQMQGLLSCCSLRGAGEVSLSSASLKRGGES